jgi:hypothetical protein
MDRAWTGLPPRQAIRAVESAGLGFDRMRGTGVILHMLSGLGIDGRVGLTAIGRDPDEAEQLQEATGVAIARAAAELADPG